MATGRSKKTQALREIPPGRNYPGKTTQEAMWEPLDDAMDLLMADRSRTDLTEFCRGVATALALYLCPTTPNITEVRRLAMARWEYRHWKRERWF
jgi:hypothetical protein